MADEVRVTEHVIEFLAHFPIEVRATEHIIEMLVPIPIEARITEELIETLTDIPAAVIATQHVIEILTQPPDLSGIYFIDPSAKHDSYYGDRAVPGSGPIDKKIPDPTIRTALFGE